MQEHPIPQDITNYRFHIVGSMTLKQFGILLLSVIIAVILYNTNLLGIIKWTLIIFSVLLGAATAFVPFEERSLDHWIFTFFSILYKPTKFYWKREQEIPDVFTYSATTDVQPTTIEVDFIPLKKQRIKEYISSVPEKVSMNTDFSPEELTRMQGLLQDFSTVEVQTQVSPPTPEAATHKPNLEVRVRSIRKKEHIPEITIFEDTTQTVPEHVAIIPTQELTQSSDQGFQKTVVLTTDQVAENIQIPEQELIIIAQEDEIAQQDSIIVQHPEQLQAAFIKDQVVHQPVVQDQVTNTTHNVDLPFPTKPTIPNVLVGMVLTQNNELLTDTIIEVQNMEGTIERAVKTNALGQFFITTPLKAGEYVIMVEKTGFTFVPLTISLKNEVVAPIEIRSQN